jgi:glucose/arabinose dehydrogenase
MTRLQPPRAFLPPLLFGFLVAFGAATGLAADIAITPLDNYEQWKAALNTGSDDPPPPITLLPGFEIERLRTARPEEGSWIALSFDPKGRAIIAREKRGLLRFTLAPGSVQVETIDDTLQEVRGLLPAFGALYANANVSRGLFRLRDTSGDDRFDQVTLLHATAAGGHGRNSLALGPDGSLALISGDSVPVLPGVHRLTPPLVPGLLPGDTLPHGHLLRVDREGASGSLVASGLRNPVGLDFNADGEAFTYDADAETDMGTPWYRPTHVRHLVSGADFGWRRVTGRWPPYYPDQPDNPPVTLATGKGSPTAIKFGTRSNFPSAYQRALFMLDWSYGRILAVHLTPSGAGYTGRAETFLRGRPLNVTGLDFGPDGAMYFVTGGRTACFGGRARASRESEYGARPPTGARGVSRSDGPTRGRNGVAPARSRRRLDCPRRAGGGRTPTPGHVGATGTDGTGDRPGVARADGAHAGRPGRVSPPYAGPPHAHRAEQPAGGRTTHLCAYRRAHPATAGPN